MIEGRDGMPVDAAHRHGYFNDLPTTGHFWKGRSEVRARRVLHLTFEPEGVERAERRLVPLRDGSLHMLTASSKRVHDDPTWGFSTKA